MISSCVLLVKIAVKFLMGRGIVVRLHTLHAVKMKVEKIVVLLHTLFAVQQEYTAVQKITIALMGGMAFCRLHAKVRDNSYESKKKCSKNRTVYKVSHLI